MDNLLELLKKYNYVLEKDVEYKDRTISYIHQDYDDNFVELIPCEYNGSVMYVLEVYKKCERVYTQVYDLKSSLDNFEETLKE